MIIILRNLGGTRIDSIRLRCSRGRARRRARREAARLAAIQNSAGVRCLTWVASRKSRGLLPDERRQIGDVTSKGSRS